MKYIMVSVRDSAAGVFGVPFFSPSVGVAIRSFSDEVGRSDAQNQLNRHPEDFELFQLGVFDDNDCDFEIFSSPKSLLRAIDCVPVKQ